MSFKFNAITGKFDIDTKWAEDKLDALYLRLDTTNDPLTGNLDLGPNNLTTTGTGSSFGGLTDTSIDDTQVVYSNSNRLSGSANLTWSGGVLNAISQLRATNTGSGADLVSVRTDGVATGLHAGTTNSSFGYEGGFAISKVDRADILAGDYGDQVIKFQIESDDDMNIYPKILRIYDSGGVIINEDGNSVNVRIESNTDDNCFKVHGTNNAVGIGVAVPVEKLEVAGSVKIDGASSYLRLDTAGDNTGTDNLILLSTKSGGGSETGGPFPSGFNRYEGNEFFNLWGASSGTALFSGGVDGDNYRRFRLKADGDMVWGSGASAVDVTLSRWQEGWLKLDGGLYIGKNKLAIDTTNEEAILVRKDSDAGDVFIVDTTNDIIKLSGDDIKLALGEAGATDSYLQFGGTNLEYFSSGLHEFTGGVKIIPNSAVPTANVEFEYKLLSGVIGMVMMNFNDSFGIGLGGVYDRLYILNDTSPQLYFADTDNAVSAYLDFDIATDTFRFWNASGGLYLVQDNVPLGFGSGKDVSTYFDGSDWI